MHSYGIELPGNPLLRRPFVRLCLSRPVFSRVRARQLAAAYLPGVSFLKAAPQADLEILFIEAEEGRLHCKDRRIELYDRWSGDGSLLDLLHLTYSAARRLWLEQELYPVHSACVGDDGYVLIVGHSGSGKTAVSLELATHHAMKIFSSNKTLVSIGKDGSVSAIAGTKTVTARTADAGKHQPSKQTSYLGRSAFKLDARLLAPPGPVRIRAVAAVRLNDGYDQCELLTAGSAMHRLYPYMLDQVNADTVVCGGKEVFSVEPPSGCRQKLAAALANALINLPVYSLSGSINFIAQQLKGI